MISTIFFFPIKAILKMSKSFPEKWKFSINIKLFLLFYVIFTLLQINIKILSRALEFRD